MWLRRAGAAIANEFRVAAGGENRAAAALLLSGLFLVLAATLVAGWIATEVSAKATQAFDEGLLRSIEAWKAGLGPELRVRFDDVFHDITALGGTPALALLTIFASVFLALSGRRQEAVLTIVVALGVLFLNTGLKHWFARPRPAFVAHDAEGFSFPSGHAMSSMAIYVTQGVLLARLAPAWAARVFAMLSVVALASLVAFSRCYLGVHYPTDVIAGALAGLAWALTVLCADEVFRRSRAP